LVARKAIVAIQDGHYNLDIVAVDLEHDKVFSFSNATDFEVFQFISAKQVETTADHHDFMFICESLAIKLNATLKTPFEEQQLKTVIIFIGLSRQFVSHANQAEITINQVFFTSGLLSRMAGWGKAAEVSLPRSC